MNYQQRRLRDPDVRAAYRSASEVEKLVSQIETVAHERYGASAEVLVWLDPANDRWMAEITAPDHGGALAAAAGRSEIEACDGLLDLLVATANARQWD